MVFVIQLYMLSIQFVLFFSGRHYWQPGQTIPIQDEMLTPRVGNFSMDMFQSFQVNIEKHLKAIFEQLENIDGRLRKVEDNQKTLEIEVKAHSFNQSHTSARPGSPKNTRARVTPTSLQVATSE